MEGIPSLPTFSNILSQLVVLVLDACAVETDPGLLVKYITFLSHHLPDEQLVPMVTLLSSIICKRFLFLKNILTDSLSLLSRFRKAFDMFMQEIITPPNNLGVEDLRILCLPSVDEAPPKEVVIQWDFLNALWLLLSLSSHYSTGDEHYLVKTLLSSSDPVKVVAMETREPQPVLKDKTLYYILCGFNSTLVKSMVEVVSLQSLLHYVGSHGVSVTNTNVIIDEIIARGVTPSQSLVDKVKSHHLRGCVSARKLLEQWGHPLGAGETSLQDLLILPKPLKRQTSHLKTDWSSVEAKFPDFLRIFSDPCVTADATIYLISNYNDSFKCVDSVRLILQVLNNPNERKSLLKDLESNEYSCILLSLLKRLAQRHSIELDSILITIMGAVKRSTTLLPSVLKNLTRYLDPQPHPSIIQAKRVLGAGVLNEPLDRAIKCDLVEVLDPELQHVTFVGSASSLLNVHILQKSIHQSNQKAVHQMVQKVLQLQTE